VRTCTRDGYQEKRLISHQFGQWDYIAGNSCQQVRICARCKEEETRIAPHEWELAPVDPETYYCARCWMRK
jgi:hypothetical protein